MSDKPKFQRMECDGCEWWTVVKGDFMDYEMPASTIRHETDALTGETVQVREMAPLDIHVVKIETRAWCSYPMKVWGLCKLDPTPLVVTCDECPLLSDDKCTCHLNKADVVCMDGDYVARCMDCYLRMIRQETGTFSPVVRTI